jgi:DNA-binding NarL/FixJ family response regulator
MANHKPRIRASDGDGSMLEQPGLPAPRTTEHRQAPLSTAQLSVAQSLQEVRETLLSYQNLSALLTTIVTRTMELSRYNGGSILLLSGPLGPLEVYASVGEDAIAVGTRVQDLAASASGYVIRTQSPLVISGRGEAIGITWRAYTKAIPAAVCLALPGINGSAIGVLTLKHTQTPHFLASHELEALQLLVARYAVMIELAHLRDTHTYLLQSRLHPTHTTSVRPHVSADSQLAQHIRQIVRSLRAKKVKVTLDETPLPPDLSATIHNVLVEIVRQSLAVIRARSMMSHAHITLRFSSSILSLEVRSWDDTSFLSDPSDGGSTAEIDGALNEIARLREQVAQHQGDSSFQIQPGIGTLLTVTLPILAASPRVSAAAAPSAHNGHPAPLGTIARLVLAEPYHITRTGLRMILSTEPYLTTVAEVSTIEDACETCQQHQPDLLLLGLYEPMPDLATLEGWLSDIRQRSPATSVLLIAQPHILQHVLQGQSGVNGYLQAGASSEELLHAVRQVVQGKTFVDPGIAPRPEPQPRDEPCDEPMIRIDHLTRREFEVLHQLAQGKTNRQIADNLSIGAGTVKTHVEHIIAKLQVSDRTQAAVRAFELGLLSNE